MAERYASPELVVTPQARELAIDIVLRPPVPLHLRPLLELVNQITVGLLPPRVREQYGFSWDPVRAVALHGGAEYVKRVVVPVLPERVRMLPMAPRRLAQRGSRVSSPSTRRQIPSGLSARSSGGSSASGAFW